MYGSMATGKVRGRKTVQAGVWGIITVGESERDSRSAASTPVDKASTCRTASTSVDKVSTCRTASTPLNTQHPRLQRMTYNHFNRNIGRRAGRKYDTCWLLYLRKSVPEAEDLPISSFLGFLMEWRKSRTQASDWGRWNESGADLRHPKSFRNLSCHYYSLEKLS